MSLRLESPIRVASVFSGAGGLDLGFSSHPEFQVVLHLDNDPTVTETLEANRDRWFHTDSPIIERDIVDYVDDVQSGDHPLTKTDVDVLIGGPPCQPFSAAARRTGGTSGTDSEDGTLFRAYCDLLKEWRPSVFLFENVYGITANEEDWNPIQEAFNDAGYDVDYRTLDTADYGVPQHRVRTFIVGSRKDLSRNYYFPKPTHGPESGNGPPLNSAGDAIGDLALPSDSEKYSVNSKYADLLPEVPPGLNYSFFTEKLGHPDPKFAWRSRFSDFLYKAIPDEPVRTLKAQPGGANGPFHWDNRRFTELELKRLQTFPDDYSLQGSYSQVVKQIGNSVPPRIASVLARSIAAQYFNWNPTSSWNCPFLPYQQQTETPAPEKLEKDTELNFRSRKRTPLEVRVQRAQSRLGDRISRDDEVDPDRVSARDYDIDLNRILPLFENSSFFSDMTNRSYRVRSVVEEGVLRLYIARKEGEESGQFDIIVESNEGYLLPAIHAERISIRGEGVGILDLVSAWEILTKDIGRRTNYEKLMSVVGHYSCARRNFSSKIRTSNIPQTPVRQLIEFFSNGENCNQYFTLPELSERTGLDPSLIVPALEKLRELRYDIRTPATHATIDADEPKIFCTYPFPNLVAASPFDMGVKLVYLRDRIQESTDELEITLN